MHSVIYKKAILSCNHVSIAFVHFTHITTHLIRIIHFSSFVVSNSNKTCRCINLILIHYYCQIETKISIIIPVLPMLIDYSNLYLMFVLKFFLHMCCSFFVLVLFKGGVGHVLHQDQTISSASS